MKRIIRAVLVVLVVFLSFPLIGIDKAVTSGEYVVPAGETLHGGLFISSPGVVTIEEGARVDGAILMGSGVLNVNGEVSGGIASVSGEVHLGPNAVVGGTVSVASVPFEPSPSARIENNLAADVSGWMGGPLGTALVLLALAGYFLYGPALGALISGRAKEGEPPEAEVAARRDFVLAGGSFLVALGVLILVRVLGVEVGQGVWAAAALVPGVLLFALMVARGRPGSSLAVPASVFVMTGLVLTYQIVADHWERWAYAWALVLPASVGVGRIIEGWWGQDAKQITAGLRVTGIGFALFAVGLIFFEVIAGVVANSAALLVGLLVIGVGIYLLVSRGLRPRREVTRA